MSKLLISDTMDAVLKRKSDGKTAITATTTTSGISSTLGINEKIWAGIGSKLTGIIRGQKEVTANFTDALFDLEYLSVTQGIAVQEDGTIEVNKREDNLVVTSNVDTLEVEIVGTPVGSTVYVTNTEGQTESATVATQVVEIPTGLAEEGDYVSVTYKEEVTGNVVELESDSFSEAYELELHTIAYDANTNRVTKDIFIQLDHVLPQGDFELTFENGTAIAPALTFDALTPANSNAMGRIAEVPRTTP